jgi:hypothetical protein
MAETEVTVPVIDRCIELQPARVLDVSGFTHIDKDKSVHLFKPPVPAPVGVSTLSGLVALMEAAFEKFNPCTCVVQVHGFDRVVLAETVSDQLGRRQEYVLVEMLQPERKFQFNEFLPQEIFNINLRSMFVQDDELVSLSILAGNIAKETEVRQQDDGFSQEVSGKAGVYLKKELTPKPRVTLKPFRTFLEVEQPAGEYIFRVRHDEQKGNLCALFEADAGRWKLTAMETIKAWLEQKLKTSEVESIRDIPVIA